MTLKYCWCFVILLSVSSVHGGEDMRPYSGLLVSLHNKYRSDVQPTAANMQSMLWNRTLEQKASAWADRCNFEHEYGGNGENLYFSTYPVDEKTIIAEALKVWDGEKKDYRFGSERCGTACHYTQMVWASSNQVGCGIKKCSSLRYNGRNYRDAWYLACFYQKRGNWIGENPYISGQPCSQCYPGQTCRNNLCTGRGRLPCDDTNGHCPYWQKIGECERNPNWMTRNCKKSCNACEGYIGGDDVDAAAAEESDIDIIIDANKGIHLCEDKLRCCSKIGTSACRTYSLFMRNYCPKTCGTC